MCDKDLPKPPDSGPGARTPVNEPVVACVAKVIPKLVSIAFLDGTDALEVASGTQFVNLTRDAKFVDGVHAKNIDRLGNKPRLKVRFDLPGSNSFKVKCLPGGGNAAYAPTEKARTLQFTYEDQERSYSTEADGTKILDDLFLAAAGKDTYTFEAVDDQGTKARTGAITTHRLIHYVQIKMAGLTAAASSLGSLEGEFAKHQITLLALPTVEMEHMPNIGASDSNTFKEKARLAYASSKGPEKEPYTMAIGYTDHLAVKNPNQKLIKTAVKVGPGESAVTIPILGVGLNDPSLSKKHLWKSLVPGEGWFVSATFLKEGGAPNVDEVPITEDKCAAVASGGVVDKCTDVKIDVSGLAAGTGTLTLEVNWVDRMRGGMSFPGGNLICICTRAWWRSIPESEQNQTMIHELGHSVGMVADGTGVRPDAIASLYTKVKGHIGNHCYMGNADGQARYDAPSDASKAVCVMYGQTSDKTAFCSNCAPVARKLTLAAGWSSF